jgi:hypothetical protein
MSPPRVPRIGFQIKVTREGGGGGAPDPEDKRSALRRVWDSIRNLITVRVR